MVKMGITVDQGRKAGMQDNPQDIQINMRPVKKNLMLSNELKE